ncbi:hypothetical protein RJT34_18093 [Clitoria ternatea]|uniref:4-hydroxy-4-methyl-2-oxoglutarate aldolase n=1 Tax=Clitoria ternatea TaxID=43366 RepID=A0AAN9PDX5_CLITE
MALVTTAEVCDANPQLISSGELRALQPIFQIYGRRQVFSGPIVTLKVFEDNVLVREFLEEKGNGRVLVVDGGASLRCAILGGNPVVQAQNNGWAGIVVNGCIRDVDEINGCDIGVRALASHPMKANKKGMGEKHVPIHIAGTRISDGEWLYADTDGILISRTELSVGFGVVMRQRDSAFTYLWAWRRHGFELGKLFLEVAAAVIATTSSCCQTYDTCAAPLCNSIAHLCLLSLSSNNQHLSIALYSLYMEEDQKDCFMLPTPSHGIAKLVSFQVDLIYNSLASLFSPMHSLFSTTSESYHLAEQPKDNVESAAQRVPSQITHGTTLLLKKLGLCFLSAAYVCMILFLVLIVATVVGVGLVRFWVEEPVSVKESLHFDYTKSHPTAVFLFNGGVSIVRGHMKKKHLSVPVSHSFSASLVLVMPESDFNRELGVFQLTAELLSVNGNVIAKSSKPCMLRFRSSPIRLARTMIMGVPLVLGISGETQNINVEILRHKEDNRRSNAIRVTLHPRAGTSSLPQLYEAEIVINSHLPWAKELVRNWKWTFYVWVSLYVYIVLLIFLLCFFRPLIFLVTPEYFGYQRVSEITDEEPEELQAREVGDESEVSELLRKWRSSKSKRKTVLAHGGVGVSETVVGSSASSISMTTREDVTSAAVDDDVEDSESVCIG